MKVFIRCCFMLLAIYIPQVVFADYEPHQAFYTQYNAWAYKGNVTSDNFGVGTLIPFNTKVFVHKYADGRLILKYGDKTFEVTANHSHGEKSHREFFAQYLGAEPVDISKFSQVGQTAIARAEVVRGMTKQEVLVSRGYPPKHATPDIFSNDWRYWTKRTRSFHVHFENGVVTSISK
jgi:hypothetical protein